jgi:CheY-like chemotaxis protein
MGGTMGVTSHQGEGSTFWFTIDVPADAASGSWPPATAEVADARILVWDASEESRRILCEQVAAFGMRPESACSPEEVLIAMKDAWAREDPFPLAILGTSTSATDDEAVTRALRREIAREGLAVVLLTPITQRARPRPFPLEGGGVVLSKPVRPSELLHLLGIVLEAHRAPAIPAGRPALPAPEPSGRRGPETPLAPARYRVLLVEDNLVNQKVGAKMLAKLGCRVDVAANGKEAVRMVEQGAYDIVFMDCQMPEMDGYEAAAEIRRRFGPQPPIVALTASAIGQDRDKCLKAGMNAFMSKPVTQEELQAALERWCPKPVQVQ